MNEVVIFIGFFAISLWLQSFLLRAPLSSTVTFLEKASVNFTISLDGVDTPNFKIAFALVCIEQREMTIGQTRPSSVHKGRSGIFYSQSEMDLAH